MARTHSTGVLPGQLAGHEFVFQTNTGIVGTFGRSISRQPFIQGEKFSFKRYPKLRIWPFGDIRVSPGGPTPLTGYTLIKSYSIGNGNRQPGVESDPVTAAAASISPTASHWLRNWLTFYTEAFTEDQFTPLAYSDRFGHLFRNIPAPHPQDSQAGPSFRGRIHRSAL